MGPPGTLVEGRLMRPWSRMGWYRSAVRGCFWIAIVAFVVIWILERLVGLALG